MPKKVDKFIEKLTKEYEKAGKTPEEAKDIAYATANKMGFLSENRENTDNSKESEENGKG